MKGFVIWSAKTILECATAFENLNNEVYKQSVAKRNKQILVNYKNLSFFRRIWIGFPHSIETDQDIDFLLRILLKNNHDFFFDPVSYLCKLLNVKRDDNRSLFGANWIAAIINLDPNTQVYVSVKDSAKLSQYLPNAKENHKLPVDKVREGSPIP